VVTANTSTSHICSQFRIGTLRILNYRFCISITCRPGHSKEVCNAYNAAAGSPNINNNNQGVSKQDTAHCDQPGFTACCGVAYRNGYNNAVNEISLIQ
jgi:hypothetical protein